MSIFTFVKSQLVNAMKNEETNGELTFNKGLPTNVITYLCNEGVLKIDKVTKERNEQGKWIYTVRYKELNNYSPFLKDTYELMEKKGYVGENKNKSVTTKFQSIYDKYRQELECPNLSSEPDEYGYAPCPQNHSGYERLAPEDNSCLELVLSKLGYDSYEEFCETHSDLSIDRIREQLNNELEQFDKIERAKEYAY